MGGASILVPGDGPYYRLSGPGTLYIYDEAGRESIDEVQAYNEAIRTIYDQSYGWKLDEEEDLVLASPRQQIANAYAAVSPNLKTVWYPSGAAALEEMAESSWMVTLATHETAHLYQLNAKGPLNSRLKKIFGNSMILVPLGLFPIFIHPNQLLPGAFLEGNAVLMESRINMGGRLHSGQKRALVLAQIEAGDITPGRLINDEFLFPYGEEAYLQGGYFMAHLAAKYGVEKTNQYFRVQGNHYIWPFIINSTFREHFGASYPQEVREYVRGLHGLAKDQQVTDGPSVFKSTFVGAMNHDRDKVFFLTTDSKEPPVLREYDKRTKSWSSKQLDLLMGKVFFVDGKVLTSASFRHNVHVMEYSLYFEGARLDPRFRGQIVTDIRAGKTAALDAGSTWLDPRVVLNGENYDVAHSSAILDDTGNIYYFRQNGTERILYRNREPLFKFDGFYAKPMEVLPDGTVYFIANTDFGSSLYQWRGHEITRVLKSDRVIDARSVSENEFLVTEVNAHGHNIVFAKADYKSQAPSTYSYGFTTQNLIPQKVSDQAAVKSSEREYNSFRELRYSSLDLGAGFSNYSGLHGSATVNFIDPLEYQSITLMGAASQRRDQALARYTFSKYLPKFFASYYYDQNSWIQRDGQRALSPEQQVTAGVIMPLWRRQRWDAKAALALNYKKQDLQNDPLSPVVLADIEETVGSIFTSSLKYAISPSLAFLPWRQFTLGFSNKLESLPSEWRKRYNTSLVEASYTYGLPREIFATLSGKFAWAERANILVTGEPTITQDIHIDRLTSHNDEFRAKTAGALRLELQKSFLTPMYSDRIPLGLNRTAPVLVGQAMFFDDDRLDRYPMNTFEWGYGVDIELLIAHRAPMRLRLVNSYDTRDPYHADEKATLNYKASF